MYRSSEKPPSLGNISGINLGCLKWTLLILGTLSMVFIIPALVIKFIPHLGCPQYIGITCNLTTCHKDNVCMYDIYRVYHDRTPQRCEERSLCVMKLDKVDCLNCPECHEVNNTVCMLTDDQFPPSCRDDCIDRTIGLLFILLLSAAVAFGLVFLLVLMICLCTWKDLSSTASSSNTYVRSYPYH